MNDYKTNAACTISSHNTHKDRNHPVILSSHTHSDINSICDTYRVVTRNVATLQFLHYIRNNPTYKWSAEVNHHVPTEITLQFREHSLGLQPAHIEQLWDTGWGTPHGGSLCAQTSTAVVWTCSIIIWWNKKEIIQYMHFIYFYCLYCTL